MTPFHRELVENWAIENRVETLFGSKLLNFSYFNPKVT